MHNEIEALLDKILRRTDVGSHDTVDDLKRDLRHIAQHAKDARELVRASVGATVRAGLEAQRDAECARANRLAAFVREKGIQAEYLDWIDGAVGADVRAGWQPIETLPDTVERCWIGHTSSRTMLIGRRDDDSPTGWGLMWSDRFIQWMPTHWMPLPMPPVGANVRADEVCNSETADT